MPETVTQAVAKHDDSPSALIDRYSTSFATVLPSHIKPATWVRLAQGALRKGDRIDDRSDPNFGRYKLEVAAQNNVGAFLAALLDAARQGLEPGTEQYYLTPRKVRGKLEILGITGYQGHIELMYRAGAVTTVTAELVHERDEFRYRLGVDRIPVHTFPAFARDSERGRIIGIYAYAEMTTGVPSRVVRLNEDAIARIKASSQGASSEYSPWVKHTGAMWLKSGVRQLQKWVPTSAEFRREEARAAGEALRAAEPLGVAEQVDEYRRTGTLDGEFVDAEVLAENPEADPWGGIEVAEPGGTS